MKQHFQTEDTERRGRWKENLRKAEARTRRRKAKKREGTTEGGKRKRGKEQLCKY
jgi:hypothetical protein